MSAPPGRTYRYYTGKPIYPFGVRTVQLINLVSYHHRLAARLVQFAFTCGCYPKAQSAVV